MNRSKPADGARAAPADAWYRQPIAWLGLAVFLGSLGGCIWMIVLAAQDPDVPTHVPTQSILGVPTQAPAGSRSTAP